MLLVALLMMFAGGATRDTVPVPAVAPWPGGGDVEIVDDANVFGGNLSGLFYEAGRGKSAATLWAIRNKPSTLYRLLWNGKIFAPDPSNGWGAGKTIRYMRGTDSPDAEGVTMTSDGVAGGIYVSAERDNDAGKASRNSVLRYDPLASGMTLRATNEWNLTSDLPVVGPNLGIEAIAWIPDAFLTERRFYDEAARHTYVPSEYASHGTGLFVVGLEGNGTLYAYALDHANNTFTRIATIATGYGAVMELSLDRELGYLWATCDDGCGNKATTLEIDTRAGSATRGHFIMTHVFDRPVSMPNLNNEGFTVAPQSECVNNLKHVFWSDDGETGGHALRRGTIPCKRFP